MNAKRYGLWVFILIVMCICVAPLPTMAQGEITPFDTAEQLVTTSTATPLVPLDLSSDIETIRQRMLHSHETWSSIWVQLHLIDFPEEGSDQLINPQRLQVWIRQPAEIMLLRGSWGDADPDYVFISDGVRYLESDLATGAAEVGDVPPSIFNPFFPPEEIADTILGHPLTAMLPYPAGEIIFPVGLAQRQGIYKLVGEEIESDRSILIVEFTPQQAALIVEFTPPPTAQIIERYYIDSLTGLILRHKVIDKTGGSEHLKSEIWVSPLVYDPVYDPDFFRLEIPEHPQFQEAPDY